MQSCSSFGLLRNISYIIDISPDSYIKPKRRIFTNFQITNQISIWRNINAVWNNWIFVFER